MVNQAWRSARRPLSRGSVYHECLSAECWPDGHQRSIDYLVRRISRCAAPLRELRPTQGDDFVQPPFGYELCARRVAPRRGRLRLSAWRSPGSAPSPSREPAGRLANSRAAGRSRALRSVLRMAEPLAITSRRCEAAWSSTGSTRIICGALERHPGGPDAGRVTVRSLRRSAAGTKCGREDK